MYLYRYSKDLRKDVSGYAYSSWKRHHKHIHGKVFALVNVLLGASWQLKFGLVKFLRRSGP